MIVRGIVTKARQHPTHPLEVSILYPDGGVLDAQWMTCDFATWQSVAAFQIHEGMEAQVWDTGYDERDRYRVTALFPTIKSHLPTNLRKPSRQGAVVVIRGEVKLTLEKFMMLLVPNPTNPIPAVPMEVSLVGKIMEDKR